MFWIMSEIRVECDGGPVYSNSTCSTDSKVNGERPLLPSTHHDNNNKQLEFKFSGLSSFPERLSVDYYV